MTVRSRQIAEEIASDEKRDRWEGAREQAQAQFESIREMVEALQLAQQDENDHAGCDAESARDRIHEDALSVEVRSSWVSVDKWPLQMVYGAEDFRPAEYRILLCTGGPAVQIVGNLSSAFSQSSEPETARLEMQDWFLPWTEYRPEAPKDANGEVHCVADAEEILLAYARQFYFGE